jgi:cysteine desulfurase
VPEASHVLLAMGLSEQDARGALRITLGHTTTDADVDAFLAVLPDAAVRAGAAGMASREPLLGR